MSAVIEDGYLVGHFAEPSAEGTDYWARRYAQGMNFGEAPNQGVVYLLDEMRDRGIALESAHVLDIGSGPNGRHSKLFVQFSPVAAQSSYVIAVDPAVDKTLRALYPDYYRMVDEGKIVLVSSPYLTLPEFRTPFHAIMHVRGPHLFSKKDRAAMFTKARDQLGTNGLFLAVSRSPDDFVEGEMEWLKGQEPGEVIYIDGDRVGQKIRLLSKKQISSELRKVGFKIIRAFSGVEQENSMSPRKTYFDGVLAIK